jgi:hypothetical protein
MLGIRVLMQVQTSNPRVVGTLQVTAPTCLVFRVCRVAAATILVTSTSLALTAIGGRWRRSITTVPGADTSYYDIPGVYRDNFSKEYGFSVRCLQRSNSTTISGTAAFPPGISGDLSGSKVSIYTSYDNWNWNQPFKFVSTDGSGDSVTYLMTNILPDNYYLDVWKDMDNSGAWSAGDYVGWYGSGGLDNPELIFFEITQGQTLNLNIQMMIMAKGAKLPK